MDSAIGKRLDGVSLGAQLWTRLRCSRCRYTSEHPGPVLPEDLDRACAACGAMLGAVTVFRISETVSARDAQL